MGAFGQDGDGSQRTGYPSGMASLVVHNDITHQQVAKAKRKAARINARSRASKDAKINSGVTMWAVRAAPVLSARVGSCTLLMKVKITRKAMMMMVLEEMLVLKNLIVHRRCR